MSIPQLSGGLLLEVTKAAFMQDYRPVSDLQQLPVALQLLAAVCMTASDLFLYPTRNYSSPGSETVRRS